MASLTGIAGQEMDEGLEEMWLGSAQGIQTIDSATENWRNQKLPLAKIKKIMKSEDVILQELDRERQEKLAAEEGQAAVPPQNEKSTKFMISGEAPVLMSKACELMIKDLSFRAWRHTERNRRRTLQKQDLHAAVGESEVYDFLIDIVPRVTTTTPKIQHTHTPHLPGSASVPGNTMIPPTISVGMQVAAGMPVGIPAALSQQATQNGTVIDHTNVGMMQLMGTAQHHQAQHQTHQHTQHQTSAQYHQDSSQQLMIGTQQQQPVPSNMHPQLVQQQQHMQHTFSSIAIPGTAGQSVSTGATVSVSTARGTTPTYDPNLTTATGTANSATATAPSHADASQWSSGAGAPEP